MGDEESLPLTCPLCIEENKNNKQAFRKPGANVTSHVMFTHNASRARANQINDEVSRLLEEKKERSAQSDLSEAEVTEKWKDENESSYDLFLEEVPVETTGAGGKRKIDLVAVRNFIDDYGKRLQMTPGERVLVDSGRRKEGPGKTLRRLVADHQGDSLQVDVYECKQRLNPKSIGQAFVYAYHLPENYERHETPVEIGKIGIIYHKPDALTEEFAKECGLTLDQV